jgi:hypothetical protein
LPWRAIRRVRNHSGISTLARLLRRIECAVRGRAAQIATHRAPVNALDQALDEEINAACHQAGAAPGVRRTSLRKSPVVMRLSPSISWRLHLRMVAPVARSTAVA